MRSRVGQLLTASRTLVGRRSVKLGAALLALLAAAALALLAQDVRGWRDLLGADGARYAKDHRASERWTPSTALPAGFSQRLLAVDRDRDTLSALRFFALAHAIRLGDAGMTESQNRLVQKSEEALDRLIQSPDPKLVSAAYDLLGSLFFTEYKGTYPPDAASLLSAVAAMQNAVRADPTSDPAQADLELVLRQEEADFVQQAQSQAADNQAKQTGKVVGRGKGVPPRKATEGDY